MRATIRHILVKTMPLARQVLQELEAGADFADLAQEYSACPSANLGGELGTFEPGDTLEKFENAIFSPKHEEGIPFGPLETEFGIHVVEITQRIGTYEPEIPSETQEEDSPNQSQGAYTESGEASSADID